MSDGKSIRQFMLPGALGGFNRVNTLAFSRDGGSLLATTGLYTLDDGKQPQLIRLSPARLVCLWDLAAGRLTHRFEGHAAAVCGAAFLEDESAVVSGSTDGTIRVWPLQPPGSGASLIPDACGDRRGAGQQHPPLRVR